MLLRLLLWIGTRFDAGLFGYDDDDAGWPWKA
jgi:hypothetical protein